MNKRSVGSRVGIKQNTWFKRKKPSFKKPKNQGGDGF